MAVELYMPKNGMDMTEGTLIRWLKNEGDRVEKDEPIIEIETDKISMEAESPASGTLLKKLYQDGASVPVLTTIGYIGQPGEILPEMISQSSASETAAPASTDADTYQVAVIGGGPAGYVAAIRAAQLGASVILFEKDTLGGTCLNRGCIPTKALLKTAEYLHHIKAAPARGIRLTGTVSVDMPSAVACKDQAVKALTTGVAALLKSNGVVVVNGKAQLESANRIFCEGKTYTAEKIILCGGSKAARIPIPGADSRHVLTSTDILNLQEVPRRLCIIGGGVIGCEFASVFQAFGSRVTIVEKMDRLMTTMDSDISKELERCMKRDGIDCCLGEGVLEIAENADGQLTVTTDHQKIECDKVLLSVGRISDLDCLGSMKNQIKVEKGRITVDETMKTSVGSIYACGDVNGRAMLAHAAFRMGEVAAENCITGKNVRCELDNVPSVLYTLPEAASIGLTEEQAREQYCDDIQIGKFPLSANSRSVASGEKDGFVKVIVDRKFGEILGVHIIGGNASEMIAEPTALMAVEITAQEVVSRLIHAHPSYSEAFAEACGDALNMCIHLPAKKS